MPANGALTNPLGLTKGCDLCGSPCGSNRALFCSIRCYLRGWQFIDYRTGCILWTGPVGNHGYGNFNLNKRRYTTHRAAYETFIGPIPDGMMVCHKCDVKICVNPEHLFLGTSADNMADCARKGRQARKLSEGDVAQIRAICGISKAELARLYGVSEAVIYGILTRRWWRHTGNAKSC